MTESKLPSSYAPKQKIDQKYASQPPHQTNQANQQSLELRLRQAQARLDRLTDLLIDEKIDQATHDRKREALQLELAKLQNEQSQMSAANDEEQDRQKFVELIKNVAALYETAAPPEKRVLVENCLSNRTWDGKNVYLEPSELIHAGKDPQCVPYGGPFKDRIRTMLDQFGQQN